MADNEKDVQNTTNDGIILKTMEEVMHESMMPYSEHVILDRALPRVEDGLKPVQRRILYSMNELGVTPDKPYRKSARIVGDCLGKYHPHGDKSVYDAMVRMAQPFSMRHMLVDGHGNFGSIDGDSAAAMRYTEARLAPLALELLRDLEKDTVRWSLNFDDTTKEPDMLPGRFPNLLVNGAAGIAVGLATNIPPHNLAEVIDGTIAMIDNPRITLAAMMKLIKGPDFPSGGFIINNELEKAYETGKGKITMRAKVRIETAENEKKNIVIEELPYQVNKAALLQSILDLREEKKGVLSGISEICDESDRNGMRAVVRVKKDADLTAILDALFKSTALQQSFGINMVAIADGKPQQLGLLEILRYYIDYQRKVIVNRTRFDLAAAKEREHILEGLLIAVRNIDEVIKIIKTSANVGEARQRLRDRFTLSERQAQAILDMRLARLTSLEVYKLETELAEVRKLIKELEAILASVKAQMEVVKSELLVIKRNFKEPRRSVILADPDDYIITADDDLKPIEASVTVLSAAQTFKRIALKSYNMALKEFGERSAEYEIPREVNVALTSHTLYCFTDFGNCYKLPVENVPECKWRDKGVKASELIPSLNEGEQVIKCFVIADKLPKGKLLFYTRDGMVKLSEWPEYDIVKEAFLAIKLKEGDYCIGVEQERKGTTVMFVTSQGICLNADRSDVPVQGRVAGGVKGIMLSPDDFTLLAKQVDGEGEIAVVTDKGYAKRVVSSSIDVMGRYRKGIKIIDFKGDNGKSLIYAGYCKDAFQLVFKDSDKSTSAYSTEELPVEPRTTKGKGILKLKAAQKVTDVFEYNFSADQSGISVPEAEKQAADSNIPHEPIRLFQTGKPKAKPASKITEEPKAKTAPKPEPQKTAPVPKAEIKKPAPIPKPSAPKAKEKPKPVEKPVVEEKQKPVEEPKIIEPIESPCAEKPIIAEKPVEPPREPVKEPIITEKPEIIKKRERHCLETPLEDFLNTKFVETIIEESVIVPDVTAFKEPQTEFAEESPEEIEEAIAEEIIAEEEPPVEAEEFLSKIEGWPPQADGECDKSSAEEEKPESVLASVSGAILEKDEIAASPPAFGSEAPRNDIENVISAESEEFPSKIEECPRNEGGEYDIDDEVEEPAPTPTSTLHHPLSPEPAAHRRRLEPTADELAALLGEEE